MEHRSGARGRGGQRAGECNYLLIFNYFLHEFVQQKTLKLFFLDLGFTIAPTRSPSSHIGGLLDGLPGHLLLPQGARAPSA